MTAQNRKLKIENRKSRIEDPKSKIQNQKSKIRPAFTMLEALATLAIAAMIIVALFAVYDRCQRVSQSVTRKIDDAAMPGEILQRIAEDLDHLAGPGSTASIEVQNNFAAGFPGARLVITTKIPDKNNKPVVLEQVTWQTSFDLASGRLILWRCHSGLVWEDKLLDEQERRDWSPDRHVFVPMCAGLSFFKIQVPQPQANQAPNQPNAGQQLLSSRRQRAQNQYDADTQAPEMQLIDQWAQPQLPPALTVTLSFASPLDKALGPSAAAPGGVPVGEIPDELKTVRTIILDHTKNVVFKYVAPLDANEPNSASGSDRDKRNKDSAADSAAKTGAKKASPSDNPRSPAQPAAPASPTAPSGRIAR